MWWWKKELVIENFEDSENLTIYYDDSYVNNNYLNKIEELNNSIQKHSNLKYFGKKSIEPLSILTIAGVYIAGKIFEGFLNKIGEKIYLSLSDKLYEVLRLQKNKDEKVLEFSLNIKKDDNLYRINIFFN